MKSKTLVLQASTLMLLLSVGVPSGAEPISISGEAVDSACAEFTQDAQEILSESDWERVAVLKTVSNNVAPVFVNAASKSFVVAFEERNTNTIETGPDGDPDIIMEDCSGGTCVIDVKVYEEAVVSARAHVGHFAFLPWAFTTEAGVTVEETVEVTTESTISCEGNLYTALTFNGAIGPRGITNTLKESETSSQTQQCYYLNIPQLDEECNIVWEAPFSIKASTPGEYTVFDILNGGKVLNQQAVLAPTGPVVVQCTPYIDPEPIDSFRIDSICLEPLTGSWQTKLAGIKIAVNNEEALALLLGD